MEGQWWWCLTKYFGTVCNASSGRIFIFESFWYCFYLLDFLFGYIKILPKEKYSKFVHVTRYLETDDFIMSNKHEFIFVVRPILSPLTYIKNWYFAQSFALIPRFTFWVCFLGTLFVSKWGPVFKNSKIARKPSESNLVADYLWIHFHGFCCFWFFAFRFTDNNSIFNCNWFICFLKVFAVLMSLSFSVRRSSIRVLYLVQSW